MTTLLLRPATMLLAAVPPGDADPSGGKGPEWGKAAPIGLLIILLMGLALFLLIKSMNRNLRKVPASFDGDEPVASGSDGGDGDRAPDGDGDGRPVVADPDGPDPRTASGGDGAPDLSARRGERG
jgi:hypothetical protein